jgi:hypothetical protein
MALVLLANAGKADVLMADLGVPAAEQTARPYSNQTITLD